MTHYEILIWIQENIVSIQQSINDAFYVRYITKYGFINEHTGVDIISIVLEINGRDLVG